MPILQNGHYADQNGSVYAPEFPVPDNLELTPHCRTNYEVSKIGSVTCKDNITITCNSAYTATSVLLYLNFNICKLKFVIFSSHS